MKRRNISHVHGRFKKVLQYVTYSSSFCVLCKKPTTIACFFCSELINQISHHDSTFQTLRFTMTPRAVIVEKR